MTRQISFGYLMMGLMTMTLFLACSKKTATITPVQDSPANQHKLARVSYDAGAYDSIYYMADGRVQSIKTVYDPVTGSNDHYSFEYNTQQYLKKIVNEDGDEYRYYYQAGMPVEISHYVSGQKTDYKVHQFQQGKLVATEIYLVSETDPQVYYLAGKHQFTYYADGNLKEESTFSVNRTTQALEPQLRVVYSDYDDGISQDDKMFGYPYRYGIQQYKNNARKRAVTHFQSGRNFEYTFTYQYNARMQPVYRKISYFENGDLIEAEATYAYY